MTRAAQCPSVIVTERTITSGERPMATSEYSLESSLASIGLKINYTNNVLARGTSRALRAGGTELLR